ncbi:MAG: ADP-ribosylglycohydrolase family protein [Eubacteriales bacterium]|nr:ADP-ribosylglycohydrolase family protein [Eubacteriales bacterium]
MLPPEVYGAIIGDIVGSRFEFQPTKRTDFELFGEGCRFTDDTVMTLAVAEAGIVYRQTKSLEAYREAVVDTMRAYGARYPAIGYGARFEHWLKTPGAGPYNSFGNGSAMRTASAAYFAEDMDEAIALAETQAAVTHNHPQGIRGARVITGCIYLAKTGVDKSVIRAFADGPGYDIMRTTADIRPSYSFDVRCQGSVPESVICFMEAESFEEAVRLAVSLGGDADTMAAMAGAVAAAKFGIPAAIRERAETYLDDFLRARLRAIFSQGEAV